MAISLQVEKFSRFQAKVLGPCDSFTFEKLVINNTLKKQTTHSFVNNVEWNETFEFLTFSILSINLFICALTKHSSQS